MKYEICLFKIIPTSVIITKYSSESIQIKILIGKAFSLNALN